MRGILRKINKQAELTENEYYVLMEYIDTLKTSSPESYAVFHDKYVSILQNVYNIFLSRFTIDFDDVINHLLFNPHLLDKDDYIDYKLFPPNMQEYIVSVHNGAIDSSIVKRIKVLLEKNDISNLPRSRTSLPIYKYEDSNPYKEQGLKTHFERIGRYSFVTRVQSYRYLTRNKASKDRLEYIKPDLLGGIFTNKQKSIYYYVYLTEANEKKANTACNILNYSLYGITYIRENML